MTRVIITAANSFIGRRLCRALTNEGYFVYAVVRNSFVDEDIFSGCQNLSIIHCDMEEYSLLHEKIEASCDVGIALAWNGTRGKERGDHLRQELNYRNSIECLHSFIRKNCRTIMTAGSQAEYGPQKTLEKVQETDECNPNTEYGCFKLRFYIEAEKICQSSNVKLIEPRFFSLYGPDDSDKTMVISTIRNMLHNIPCELTHCIQMWDFLYIDDAINGLIRLLQNKHAEGVYNFGSGVSKQLKDYIEIMRDITGSKSQLLYGAIAYPDTGMVHTNPSVRRLCKTIDWRPEVSFEEGIRKVIAAQRQIGGCINEKNKYSSAML